MARGLFCVRVNAVGTDLARAHDVIERDNDGGFTVRYQAGPKIGLDIHFFDERELASLLSVTRRYCDRGLTRRGARRPSVASGRSGRRFGADGRRHRMRLRRLMVCSPRSCRRRTPARS
jgi:hypothetical protein